MIYTPVELLLVLLDALIYNSELYICVVVKWMWRKLCALMQESWMKKETNDWTNTHNVVFNFFCKYKQKQWKKRKKERLLLEEIYIDIVGEGGRVSNMILYAGKYA